MYFNFIGMDGSGKDTIANELLKQLPSLNDIHYLDDKKIMEIKEPGGTSAGEIIRKVLLSKTLTSHYKVIYLEKAMKENIHPRTRLLLNKAIPYVANDDIYYEVPLFAAARNELIQKVISPNRDTYSIIGKRSVACSMAYQAHGRNFEGVWEINHEIILDGGVPDFEIFIDIPAEVAMKRIEHRGNKNRLDELDVEFFNKVREGYLEYYERTAPYNCFIINGDQGIDEVTEEVINIISKKQKVFH